MAAPIITDVEVHYPNGLGYKLPGQPAEITVTAQDADALSIEVEVRVRDASGATVAQTATVVQNDPLTFEAEGPAGQTVTQDPTQPNHFYVV